ncbi:spherulin 4-like cell surface protein [Boeremia exigua]|uniref:spherulin 4-like cell surface protein n=1 Tax=Boeremia exigua TaxID=749465 RepID=UPI001E8CBBBA|nr:spherulin 4-like cell surface protein [Boeremia exigua]KAH6612975.1 spherulin 4-like cell surface protein [Boeremia exigua]
MDPKIELPTHWYTLPPPTPVETAQETISTRPFYKRPRVISIISAVVIALIIAIVVPLAVILPKNSKAEERHTSIMLPLYIYPETNATWAPLYSALSARPDLKFTVIINPGSGPGSSQYPDERYAASLERLATYSNVEKLGYVHTLYATRNLSEVISDLNVYAGWVSGNQAFAMDGVFFDESPHEFSQEAVDFMLSASQAVKDAQGFQGSKLVVRNPGVVPDSRFTDSNTDISVLFEQTHDEYKLQESELSAMNHDRAHHCFMVHSLPTMEQGEMQGFVDTLSRGAEYLFVTSNAGQYYEQFGADWSQFVETIAT